MCKICNSPEGRELTKRVLLGEMSIYQLAKYFGVSYEEAKNHIEHHVVNISPVADQSYPEMLKAIISKLWRIVQGIDVNRGDIRALPSIVKELRQTVTDLTELQKQIKTGELLELEQCRSTLDKFINALRKIPREYRQEFEELIEREDEEEGENNEREARRKA